MQTERWWVVSVCSDGKIQRFLALAYTRPISAFLRKDTYLNMPAHCQVFSVKWYVGSSVRWTSCQQVIGIRKERINCCQYVCFKRWYEVRRVIQELQKMCFWHSLVLKMF